MRTTLNELLNNRGLSKGVFAKENMKNYKEMVKNKIKIKNVNSNRRMLLFFQLLFSYLAANFEPLLKRQSHSPDINH